MSEGSLKITPDKTWVPIGVAVAGLAAFVTGAFWVGLAYQKILSNQDVQGATLQRLERKIDGVSDDFVTRERFAIFVEMLKAANPAIIIPPVPR